MKVYLIKTPEYEIEEFRAVCDFLNCYDGILEFIPSFYEFNKGEFYFLQYELFPEHVFSYPSNETAIKFDSNRGAPLSWRELYSLCDYYREIFRIENDAFVVLLTKRKNSLNWFSSFDGRRNIFVNTAEWNQFTSVSSKYPISYQILENIMKSLMNLDIANDKDTYLHEPVRGCMNDFCVNKNQIIIKLQTANICLQCMERIKMEQIDVKIIQQVRHIFNDIRNEFIFLNDQVHTEPTAMVIDKNGKILLPEFKIEIKLSPLFKTLYLFLLTKEEGVTLNHLSDFKKELLAIYLKVKPYAIMDQALMSIQNLTHPLGDGFNPAKSHINKNIVDLLGDPLSEFYKISGEKGKSFSVKIPRNLLDLRLLV